MEAATKGRPAASGGAPRFTGTLGPESLDVTSPTHRRFPALAILVSFVASGALAAQAPPDSAPAAELAPVVVEVFRTPVVLERVPFSASVVGESQIRKARPGLALDEALRGVPGVQVDNRHIYALGERISVRGFGARAQFGVRGVRVVADGIPATFADGQSALEIVDPALLGRAEVIRGPASALYGNAAGGVIVLRAAPPADAPLEQRYRLVVGEHGLQRLEGGLSGRAGAADYRLRLSHFAWDGFREHGAAELRRASGAVGYALGGGVLRLSGAWLDFDAQNPGALPAERFRTEPHRAAPLNVERGAGKEGRQRQLGLGWSRPLAAGELEVLGYGIDRWIRNPIVPFVIDLDRGAAGLRAAYRGRLAGERARWSAGLDLDVQRDDRQNYVNMNGEPGAKVRDQLEHVRSAAPYVHLSLRPVPRWHLLGGLRYDRFSFAVADRLAAEGRPDESGARVMAAWSPSAGVLYEWHPALALFGNVATAFETPTTTELANRPDGAGGFNPELEPQRTLSYELGARGTHGVVGYQLAVYHAEVENALIPFEVPDAPGRTYFRNAGAARHRGLEASAWVRPRPGLLAQLGYTLTDAVFRDYQVAAVRYDGNRVPGVAPHRWELTLLYEAPAGPYLGLDVRRLSAVPADDANSEHAPAYTVADVRAGHDTLRLGRLAASPFAGITNLFNRAYAASVVPNAAAAAGQPRPFYEPGPGRSFYAGVEVRVGGRR